MAKKSGCPVGTKKIGNKCVPYKSYEVAESFLTVKTYNVKARSEAQATKLVIDRKVKPSDTDQMDYQYDAFLKDAPPPKGIKPLKVKKVDEHMYKVIK